MGMQTLLSGGKPIRWNGTAPSSPGPHPAILLLHGSGGNVDFWLDRITSALVQAGIAAFAVHYFDRTGTARADLVTLSDGIHIPLWLDTVRDAVAFLAARREVDPARIALVGISLGAFLALALGSEPEHTLRAIVDISGGLVPPYDVQATSTFPPTLIVHGEADTIVSISHAHALATRLTDLAVAHELHLFPGEGHWFSAPAQASILSAIPGFLKRFL